jgi:hypothetical protein
MALPVKSLEAPAMRRPRIRFREFVLLTTLVSLITAAFAIRARTASHLSALDHALHGYRARRSVTWWEDLIKERRRYLETTALISEDWATGRDLRLMPSVKDAGEIPRKAKDLIIVADVSGVLYFRMFDGDGRIVMDWAEGMQIEDLQKQLASLWPPHELTEVEKRQVITAVISILGRSRATLQAQLRSMQTTHAEAVANAEYHERLARNQGP